MRKNKLTTRDAMGALDTRDCSLMEMQVKSKSINEESRTFECVATTENPARVFNRNHGIIQESLLVDGVKYKLPLPLLANHNPYDCKDDLVGQVTGLKVEGNKLIASVKMVKDDPDAEKLFNKIKQGVLSTVSVGYTGTKHVIIDEGKSEVINGKEFKATKDEPLFVAKEWNLMELSLVSIPADADARIKSGVVSGVNKVSESSTNKEIKSMNKELEKYLRHLGLKDGATVEEANSFKSSCSLVDTKLCEKFESGDLTFKSWQEENSPSMVNAPTVDPNVEAEVQRQLQAHKEQNEQFERSVRKLGTEFGIPEEKIVEAVRSHNNLADVGKFFLEVQHEQRQKDIVPPTLFGVNTGAGQKSDLHDTELLVDIVASRCIANHDVSSKPEEYQEAVHKNRSMTVTDCARLSLEMAGIRIGSYDREEIITRAVSTHVFSNLLSNVANKVLGTSFQSVEGTARQWMGVKNLKDFKLNTQVRVSGLSELEEMGDAGEFPVGDMTDEAETYRLKTFGKKITFTRQQMINDDLGALGDGMAQLGRAANRTREKKGYLALLENGTMGDGTALFATSRSNPNYFAGASTNLQASSLQTAKKMFREQIDPNGDPLQVAPKYLIVPPALEGTALQLLNSELLKGNTDEGNANIHRGTLQLIVEPYLSTGIDGNGASDLAWYLAGDYNQEEHIALAYLNGNQSPVIQPVVVEGGLYMAWVCYFDVTGVRAGWRNMVKSKGEA